MLRHWFLYYGKIFLVSLSTLSSLAASELQNLNRQPFFEFFNPDDIPAHEQNWAIDFDQLGRVYVANTNGMLMFDGIRWKGFSTTKLGITRAIVVKDSDKIFVGGQNALGFFEAQPDGTWQFENISIPVELGNVGAIWQGILLNDDIYFASDNYLIKIDSNQSVTARKSKGRVSVGQSGNFSWAFVPGDGLYDLSKSFQHAAFKNTKVRIMGVHKSADSWLVIYRNGKLVLIQSDNLYHPNNRTYIKNKALKDQVVTSVSEVPGGTAVTTANNGLVLLNESGQTVKHINVFDSWVLNSNYFNGNLWIAQDGAIIRMPWPITFERIMDESGMGHVLESITQYNNEIYVGSTKGLFKFDKNLRLFTPVHLSNQPSTVWELEPTVAGLLAITDYGTYLLKNKTASLVIAGHTRGFVALQEPKNHYLVTSHLNGTYLLKANLNGIKVAASDPALQLNSSNIIQSADGSIFVDTRKNGVYRIRLKTDLSMQVDHLNLNQLAVGMESKETNTMEPNTSVFLMDNIPIVNSFGRFCRPEFDTLKKCILENRFVQDYGDQSFETKQHDGTLYFDGHEGYMYQIKPDKFGKYARQYSNMDELGNSNLTDLLEFGTETLLTRHDGLWVMHPDRLKSSLLPKVWISDINIGTEWPYQAATLLQKIPTVISANLDRIRFYFGTDTRAASKYHLWRTKLEGYNNEYSEWSNQSWQDFTRLSGGDYKLLIQLKIRSGRVSTPYSLNFSVAYPWYLSTLAKVIYTFTIVGLLILFTVMYSRRKNRLLLLRQTELESQVSQRTTELQINQRELTAQARKLVELDKAKSRFFANITHEFRTPLTLMIGPLTDLVKGRFGQLVPAQKKPINLAINRSSGLLELIEELLDVSRLDAGVLVLNAQKVNVIELVKNAIAQLDSWSVSKQILIEKNFKCERFEIVADPRQIERVIYNLFGNAIKFTPENGRINVDVNLVEKGITIKVSDSGIGIEAKEIKRIFERFHQVAKSQISNPGGVGLGLSLAKEITDLHNGKLDVESVPGKGTIFTLYLPTITGLQIIKTNERKKPQRLSKTSIQEESSLPFSGDSHGQSSKTTILVVEDDSDLRSYIVDHLIEHYRVLESPNGQHGFEQAKRALPDLILSDVMMPIMDGVTMCQQLKSDQETDFIPVILLTAKVEDGDRIEGFDKGADDYLAKPFNADVLKSRVANLIASRRKLLAKVTESGVVFPQVEGLLNRDLQFVERFQRAVQEGLSDSQYSIENMAHKLNMDRSTLYTKVLTIFNATPSELIRKARLSWAKELILQHKGAITDVAFTVGYATVAHFSQSFKKEFKCTPSQMRKT